MNPLFTEVSTMTITSPIHSPSIDCPIPDSKPSRGAPRAPSQHPTANRRSGHCSRARSRAAAQPSGGHHSRPLFGRPSPLSRSRHRRNRLGSNRPPLGPPNRYWGIGQSGNRMHNHPLPPLWAPQLHGSRATFPPFHRWSMLAPRALRRRSAGGGRHGGIRFQLPRSVTKWAVPCR